MASGSEEESGGSGRRRGRCKWFNVAKGWGFITPDDGGQDVFVHQSVIQMTGFRSLGDDEELEFEAKESDKGLEATLVTAVGGGDCKGSTRRPMSKKRFRKVRCYNCGEFANHIAAKCTMGPQPKRCHSCKSDDHLIADCPNRETKRTQSSSDDGSSQCGKRGTDEDPDDKTASNGASESQPTEESRPSPSPTFGPSGSSSILSTEEIATEKLLAKEEQTVTVTIGNGSISSAAPPPSPTSSSIIAPRSTEVPTRQHSSSTSSGGSANGKITKL